MSGIEPLPATDTPTRGRIGQMLARDPTRLDHLFGHDHDLLPLWIAEPYLPLAPAIVEALEDRTRSGWYGYETRPSDAIEAFRSWMERRHGWTLGGAMSIVSPSIGTSIGAALELLTEPGDGVILQPPVFTDFKPLVAHARRTVVRNPLVLHGGRYTMDLDGLAEAAAHPTTTAMILCNPHNPVGRVWHRDELVEVAAICARHEVFVIADEIHADLMLGPSVFVPFADAANESGARWAALHGPIKTFGLAGVADTLIVTTDDAFADDFKAMSSRLHLVRNNVFSLAATDAAYRDGDTWLDATLAQVAENASSLASGLPDPVRLVEPEGTYLAWLDFRDLGLDVPALATWLASEARLAMSPGHWFGREGAGFARMSIGVEATVLGEAMDRLTTAIAARS